MNKSVQSLEAEVEKLCQERDAGLQRELALQQTLGGAMDREAVTAEVLAALSRTPVELEAVLKTIGNAARRLCDADAAYMFVVDIQDRKSVV